MALSESLNVLSEVQSTWNAIKVRLKKGTQYRQNCWLSQFTEVSKVVSGESPIGQCIEHLTFAGTLKIKYAPIVWCDAERGF